MGARGALPAGNDAGSTFWRKSSMKETTTGAASAKANAMLIQLPKLNIQFMSTKVVGDSSLIVHRFSEKAKKQMLDKQMRRARAAKAAKDPTQDYLDSLYP